VSERVHRTLAQPLEQRYNAVHDRVDALDLSYASDEELEALIACSKPGLLPGGCSLPKLEAALGRLARTVEQIERRKRPWRPRRRAALSRPVETPISAVDSVETETKIVTPRVMERTREPPWPGEPAPEPQLLPNVVLLRPRTTQPDQGG